jgi:hypothetical protein
VRTRSALPGENPPGCDTASTTSPPRMSAIASRTWSGRSPQPMRTPDAVTMASMVRVPVCLAQLVF